MTASQDVAGPLAMTIARLDGPYRPLANPWRCPVQFEGIDFPGGEWAFQAAKSLDWAVRSAIAAIPDWHAAKATGRGIALRPGWDVIKRSVMMRIVLDKFTRNPDLARLLNTTRGCTLIEGNTWGDDYWGAVPFDGRHTTDSRPVWAAPGGYLYGHNWLGRILMMTRDLTDLGI